MESVQTKERSWLRNRFVATLAAGCLAVTGAIAGDLVYNLGTREAMISPIGWHDGDEAEVIASDCNTLTSYDACEDSSTWTVTYRECRDDNFVGNIDNPPGKTPDNCVDWTIHNVPNMPDNTPILQRDNEEYPNPVF
jgi:hypothetical protein